MPWSRWKSLSALHIAGRSQHFEACYELELSPGAELGPKVALASEELLTLLSGEALISVEHQERRLKIGEVVLVPARRWRGLRNISSETARLLRITGRSEAPVLSTSPESLQSLDEVLEDLARQELSELTAIQSIIRLFDVGGQLTEQIERAVGFDNEPGREALVALQKKLMARVVEVAKRYRERVIDPKMKGF